MALEARWYVITANLVRWLSYTIYHDALLHQINEIPPYDLLLLAPRETYILSRIPYIFLKGMYPSYNGENFQSGPRASIF